MQCLFVNNKVPLFLVYGRDEEAAPPSGGGGRGSTPRDGAAPPRLKDPVCRRVTAAPCALSHC